jgi:hypothetical protein
MERFLEAVSLNIKELGPLQGRNEESVRIVYFQGVGSGFDDFCHTITTRNDRVRRKKFNEINRLTNVTEVECGVIENRVGSKD